jgi:hypothetical protein
MYIDSVLKKRLNVYQFQDGETETLPDIATAKFLCNYLGVTDKTLKRYRELAYLVPDYLKVCDRYWEHKTKGLNYECVEVAYRIKKLNVPARDEPPFILPQMQILRAIARMVKSANNDYAFVQSRLVTNKKIWKEYHAI